MTHADLARFRAGFASCELTLLVDLSAGTVLLSDSAIPIGQERLDQLCAMARTVFGGRVPATGIAILSSGKGNRLFVQSRNDPTQLLCALFAPSADLASASAAAAELLDAGQTL